MPLNPWRGSLNPWGQTCAIRVSLNIRGVKFGVWQCVGVATNSWTILYLDQTTKLDLVDKINIYIFWYTLFLCRVVGHVYNHLYVLLFLRVYQTTIDSCLNMSTRQQIYFYVKYKIITNTILNILQLSPFFIVSKLATIRPPASARRDRSQRERDGLLVLYRSRFSQSHTSVLISWKW